MTHYRSIRFYSCLVLFLGFIFSKAGAQDYNISFTGSGMSTWVDSVKIENITKGTKKTIRGSDVLHLSPVNGINETYSYNNNILVHPNPFTYEADITIGVEKSGPAQVHIFDATGRSIYQNSLELLQGVQQIKIEDLGPGIYILNIQSNSYNYLARMISQSVKAGTVKLTNLGKADPGLLGKTLKTTSIVEMFFTSNNVLHYTGYSAKYNTMISEIPTASKTVTFIFPSIPDVNTRDVTSIKGTTATSGGTVASDCYSSVTARGVCWSTSPNPTTTNSKTSEMTGTGSFTSTLTGLTPNTKYYIRSYATNAVGTSYGNEKNFTTRLVVLPAVTTDSIKNVLFDGALSGGTVTSNGGAEIIARGVCFDTIKPPTIAKGKTTDSFGLGSYTSTITNIKPHRKYYVRAYATNELGIGYGKLDSFTTLNLAIGQFYMGGYIAYLKDADHGFVTSPYDQDTFIYWGVSGAYASTGTAIGTGMQNTINLQACTTYYMSARICYNLVLGGYNDWYMPSKDEMHQIAINKSMIPNLAQNKGYWSSSLCTSSDYTYQIYIKNNISSCTPRSYYSRVRCIRDF